MSVALYQVSRICGCYVLIFGNGIGMKKIQKNKIFVVTLVIRFNTF